MSLSKPISTQERKNYPAEIPWGDHVLRGVQRLTRAQDAAKVPVPTPEK